MTVREIKTFSVNRARFPWKHRRTTSVFSALGMTLRWNPQRETAAATLVGTNKTKTGNKSVHLHTRICDTISDEKEEEEEEEEEKEKEEKMSREK
jgi:hypothetical protein